MNKRIIIETVLLVAAGLQAAWAQGIRVWQNGRSVYYELGSVDSIAFDGNRDIHGYEWVDLGLPSGTLWATTNMGARTPDDYGNFNTWGDTGIHDYKWSDYYYCEGSENTLTKYCTDSSYGIEGFTDGLTELLPEDDNATVRLGSGWQMPSIAQWQELLDSNYTTTTWTSLNGYHGTLVTSNSNGKSIFLPPSGHMTGTKHKSAGTLGFYWSRMLDTDSPNCACYVETSSSSISYKSAFRCYGQSIRPVRVHK